MRSFIAAVLLFSFTLGCVIFNSLYVNSIFDKISVLSEEISTAQEKESKLSELNELWNRSQNLLSYSIRESKLERMTELIESLYAAYSADNKAEFQKLCSLIIELCEEIRQYEQISLHSVF